MPKEINEVEKILKIKIGVLFVLWVNKFDWSKFSLTFVFYALGCGENKWHILDCHNPRLKKNIRIYVPT